MSTAGALTTNMAVLALHRRGGLQIGRGIAVAMNPESTGNDVERSETTQPQLIDYGICVL